jgi:hypothetical protein
MIFDLDDVIILSLSFLFQLMFQLDIPLFDLGMAVCMLHEFVNFCIMTMPHLLSLFI